jgi:hypothetical protein
MVRDRLPRHLIQFLSLHLLTCEAGSKPHSPQTARFRKEICDAPQHGVNFYAGTGGATVKIVWIFNP